MLSRASVFFAALALAISAAHAKCPGSVIYRFSNVCEWTNATHPTDFPANAMFSPMCGTSHNANYELFASGGISTDGVREIAETGNCSTLEGEIDFCEAAGSCTTNGFFSFMCDTSQNDAGVTNGVCSHSGMINVSTGYPYVSAMSMIAPSPDWFVGIASVNLCQEDPVTGNFSWIERYPSDMQMNLYAYNAGTDGGTTFLSPDLPLDPFMPITVFNATNASNIFYNQEAGRLYPLCRVMLELAY